MLDGLVSNLATAATALERANGLLAACPAAYCGTSTPAPTSCAGSSRRRAKEALTKQRPAGAIPRGVRRSGGHLRAPIPSSIAAATDPSRHPSPSTDVGGGHHDRRRYDFPLTARWPLRHCSPAILRLRPLPDAVRRPGRKAPLLAWAKWNSARPAFASRNSWSAPHSAQPISALSPA